MKNFLPSAQASLSKHTQNLQNSQILKCETHRNRSQIKHFSCSNFFSFCPIFIYSTEERKRKIWFFSGILWVYGKNMITFCAIFFPLERVCQAWVPGNQTEQKAISNHRNSSWSEVEKNLMIFVWSKSNMGKQPGEHEESPLHQPHENRRILENPRPFVGSGLSTRIQNIFKTILKNFQEWMR